MRIMPTAKNKTAQHRESIADTTPQHTPCAPVGQSPQNSTRYPTTLLTPTIACGDRSSHGATATTTLTVPRIQKENHARLRAKHPRTTLPIHPHRYTRRGRNRALVELKPPKTPAEPQSVTQEKDHQLRPESHTPTRQPAIVKRHARHETTTDTIA